MYGTNRYGICDEGIRKSGLKEGARILDIGCGEGRLVHHLREAWKMDAEGIDINLAGIAQAKEEYPDLPVHFGDGEFLDDYMSYTFDGVLYMNSLSLINMPDESLHEAYCVMKKGGHLIITDLYEIDPDPAQMKAVRMEARRLAKVPRKEGDCEDRGMKFVDFRFEGAFFKEPLIRQLEETGFHGFSFEDITDQVPDIDALIRKMIPETAADQIMTPEGHPDRKPADKAGRQAEKKDGKRKIGAFRLVAAKPL